MYNNKIIRLIINILHVISGLLLVYYFRKHEKNNIITIIMHGIIVLFAWIISSNNRLNINDYYFTISYNIDIYTQLIKIWHVLLSILIILLFYNYPYILHIYKNNEYILDRLIVIIGIYMTVHHGNKIYQKI
tara:strand:- start:1076 stop:1471 length:396 start_codon:yes stop_codon:yes gene_type:complete